MVIAIMGILAAIALPSIRGLKPNAKVAGTRQLLDAVGRARQLAVSQRTTVYMVFVPASFWTDPAYAYASWTTNDQTAAASLLDKQLIGYAYVCLRSVGDQPGMHTPRYLSSWKTLPQGAFIPPAKFIAGPVPVLQIWTNRTPATLDCVLAYQVYGFNYTTSLPFPSETTPPAPTGQPYIRLPYIAFDGMGQLVSGRSSQVEMIPVSEGSVTFARDAATKVALPQPPQVNEVPPDNTTHNPTPPTTTAWNTTNNYSLVQVDRLTGRAHVERRKVQ
jgi:hypothetical protein